MKKKRDEVNVPYTNSFIDDVFFCFFLFRKLSQSSYYEEQDRTSIMPAFPSLRFCQSISVVSSLGNSIGPNFERQNSSYKSNFEVILETEEQKQV